MGLAVSVAASQVSYAGLALNALSLLGNEDEGQADLRVPLALFDTTTMALPHFLVNNKNSLGHKKIQVLYTSELEIRSVLFEYLGSESLDLAGRQFLCQKFSKTSDHDKGFYWVA